MASSLDVQVVEPAGAPRRVVVVHHDRKSQRVLHRMAAAAVRGVEVVADLEAGLARAPHVCVVDAQAAPLDLPKRYREIAWIAVPGDGSLPTDSLRAAALLEAGWRHVVTQPAPLLGEELVAVLGCLIGGVRPDLDHLLLAGAPVVHARLDDTSDREPAVAALVADVVKMGLSDRVASLASVIADELLSNAIFAGPVDAQGNRPHLADRRDVARPLVGRDAVELRWSSDARYLAIEIRDRWGSLDVAALGPRLAAGVRGTVVDYEGGMGLSLVHACCQRLHLAVAVGTETSAIALIDLRNRASELARTGSVHLYGGDA
jgi:hypothetical protein